MANNNAILIGAGVLAYLWYKSQNVTPAIVVDKTGNVLKDANNAVVTATSTTPVNATNTTSTGGWLITTDSVGNRIAIPDPDGNVATAVANNQEVQRQKLLELTRQQDLAEQEAGVLKIVKLATMGNIPDERTVKINASPIVLELLNWVGNDDAQRIADQQDDYVNRNL
jgi:hypothetical protein